MPRVSVWKCRRCLTGATLVLASIAGLSVADQPPQRSPPSNTAIEVLGTWRTRRYGPDTAFSEHTLRAANQSEVVLIVEVGGLLAQDMMIGPEVYLISSKGRWPAEMTVIGQPADDPLGIRGHEPLFLFKVPSSALEFTLRVGNRASVAFTANRPILRSLE